MEPIAIVALVFAILLVVFTLMFLVLRSLTAQGEAAVRARYPDARLVIPSANFFGQESRGVGQLRGNGTLALTDQQIYFRKWVPVTEYTIPFASIQAIETPLAFLGKSYGRRLLKIVYLTDAGTRDSIAWYVPNLDAVKDQIEMLRAA